MNEHDKYLFDLQGFLVIPDALTRDQVKDLNDVLDEHVAKDVKPDATSHRLGVVHTWGGPYQDLIDLPRMTPYIEMMNGRDFRLDHTYIDIIRSGKSPIGATLHGGGTPWEPSQFYHVHNGTIHCALTVVAYNLHDVNPGDGGFACVAGSHKANFVFPEEWKNLEQSHPCVTKVAAPAGTAIIFTEALTHGPLPWTAKHERRTIFYKYNTSSSTWAVRPVPTDLNNLTNRQREIVTGLGNAWAREQRRKAQATAK